MKIRIEKENKFLIPVAEILEVRQNLISYSIIVGYQTFRCLYNVVVESLEGKHKGLLQDDFPWR